MRLTTAMLLAVASAIAFGSADAQIAHVEDGSGKGSRRKPGPRPPIFFPLSPAIPDTLFFGGTHWDATDARWEANSGDYWTFDSGVASTFSSTVPGLNPHKAVGLHTLMEGWLGVDRTYSTITYFRRLASTDIRWGSDVCVGSPAGLGGVYSFWCGVFPGEADSLCWAAGQGYGNNWAACIGRTFAYAGGGVTLEFDYVNETEPGFDVTEVIVDTTGSGDEVVVGTFDGPLSGNEVLVLSPGESLPSAAGNIDVKFCFRSDGGRSDEDGLYATDCGAFAVDNIVMSGGIVHSATFEAGAAGWALLTPAPGPGGDWSDIVDLGDLPPPLTPCSCAMSDSVLVFEDLMAGGHGAYQHNVAVSPWIDLDQAGAVLPGKLIQFDGYFRLPFLNYVFVLLESQYYPKICPATGDSLVSPWVSDGLYRYFGTVPRCSTTGEPFQVDITGQVASGATEVRIAVGVVNYCRFMADCTGVTNSSPWFDNICMGVFGDAAVSLICDRPPDRPQDGFPENGTLDIAAPGRIDANNTGNLGGPEAGTSLGDTLTVCGGTGMAEVYVQFAVTPGPGVNGAALANWLSMLTFAGSWNGQSWYSVRMDTAEVGGIPARSPLTWMTAYHESEAAFSGSDTDLDPTDLDPRGKQSRLLNDIFPDKLFTAGTRINLFYKTRLVGGTAWYTLPDTTGGEVMEWECLPSSMGADSTFNCVLYVDHFNRGAQDLIETGLTSVLGTGGSNFEGTNWDRYDVEAADSRQGSFGRPLQTEYGATVVQALGYDCIIWNSGINPSGNLSREDADVLLPWLTLADFDFKSLYLSGDGLAASAFLESASEPSARKLLENIAGVSFTCNTFRDTECPTGKAHDATACVDLDPVGGAKVGGGLGRTVGHQVFGNGCPRLHSFDVIDENPSPDYGVATADEEYSTASTTAQYASVAIDAADNGPLNYRIVTDGASVHLRRDAGGGCGSGVTAVTERLEEVLDFFGHSEGGGCSDPTLATGSLPGPPGFATALLDARPNPLRAGTPAEFRFTMAAPGHAVVEVFDLQGRLVRTVFRGPAGIGENRAAWPGTDSSGRRVAGGVYFYRLTAGGRSFTGKLVVIGSGG